MASKDADDDADDGNTITIGTAQYITTKPPTMFPVGYFAMIHDESNHMQVLTNRGNIVIMGSGFHAANAFAPTIAGLIPDIKSDSYNPQSSEGIITFTSIDEICASVEQATSVQIRHNPLDEKEKNIAKDDTTAITALAMERTKQLATEKNAFVRWLRSLSNNHSMTRVCFVRNVYPMDSATGMISPCSAKPVWVTGLGVTAALDCGSGKVALVDGTTGQQLGDNKTWQTNVEDPKWTDEVIAASAKMIAQLRDDGGGDGTMMPTIAYGTGNWRKEHMADIWPKFKVECVQYNIEFNLLSGDLEAKYGGISALKLAAPFSKEEENWVVLEMGGGSTQVSSFEKIRKV